jgi:adenylate cyclase
VARERPTAVQGKLISGASAPSIAVFPFVNLSVDPGQEFFADGLAEDILTGLSLSRSVRHLFRYKGKAVDVPTIARELGVVLEGSVRITIMRRRSTIRNARLASTPTMI